MAGVFASLLDFTIYLCHDTLCHHIHLFITHLLILEYFFSDWVSLCFPERHEIHYIGNIGLEGHQY